MTNNIQQAIDKLEYLRSTTPITAQRKHLVEAIALLEAVPSVDDEFLDDIRKTRTQVMLKYYCQQDGRLATPLANACPELGRLLGTVGDLIDKLSPIPQPQDAATTTKDEL